MTHTLFGRKFEFFAIKYLLFIRDVVTQDMYIKRLKHLVDSASNNTVGCIVKTVKQIRCDIDNCINRHAPVNSFGHGKFDIETGICNGYFWNDMTLYDDTPFVCLYSKNDNDKFFVLQDSPWFIQRKNKYGIREIIGGLLLETDPEILNKKYSTTYSFGTQIIDTFQYVFDPEKFYEFLEKLYIEEEQKNNIDTLIKEIDDRYERLKVLIKERK